MHIVYKAIKIRGLTEFQPKNFSIDDLDIFNYSQTDKK